MADLLASFETGFDAPSLENPQLFSRYADEIATRLVQQFPAHAGYRIRVKKREEDPRRREWQVEVQRGWFSGARVMIKPLTQTPHRARVKVGWHSRLLGAMEKGFAIISIVPLVLFFLAAALKTRLGFALIVTVVIGVAWGLAGAIVMLLVARLFAMIFGDEFKSQTRIGLADKIQQFPLPKAASKA